MGGVGVCEWVPGWGLWAVGVGGYHVGGCGLWGFVGARWGVVGGYQVGGYGWWGVVSGLWVVGGCDWVPGGGCGLWGFVGGYQGGGLWVVGGCEWVMGGGGLWVGTR